MFEGSLFLLLPSLWCRSFPGASQSSHLPTRNQRLARSFPVSSFICCPFQFGLFQYIRFWRRLSLACEVVE